MMVQGSYLFHGCKFKQQGQGSSLKVKLYDLWNTLQTEDVCLFCEEKAGVFYTENYCSTDSYIYLYLGPSHLSHVKQKGSLGNFDQNVYFSISWMCIILSLICEILSGIAVEIRFLWDSKHGIYGCSVIYSNYHVMISTHGHEKIYFSYFVYEHHLYHSVTIWS